MLPDARVQGQTGNVADPAAQQTLCGALHGIVAGPGRSW